MPAPRYSVGLLGTALLLAACEDPQPPPAPFGARNLFQVRDPEIQLERFDPSRTRLFYSRTLAEYGGGASRLGNRLFDLWAIELASGKSELVAEKVRWFFPLPAEGSKDYYGIVRQESQYAPFILTLVDPESGTRQDYDGVVPASIAWSERWIVFIRDHLRSRELWAGPWASPQKASGALYAHDWAWFDQDQLALAASVSAAALPSGSTTVPPTSTLPGMSTLDDPATNPGIYRVDIASGSVAEEVPAEIETATWTGSDPAPSLKSSGLQLEGRSECCSVAVLHGSCWSKSDPKAWGAADQQCYLAYHRAVEASVVRLFVYAPGTRQEFALPTTYAYWVDVPGSSAYRLPWYEGNGPVAVFRGASSGSGDLFIWNAESERLLTSDTGQLLGWSSVWRDDGRAIAYATGDRAAFVDADQFACTPIDAADATSLGFAPDGSRLIWSSPTGLWQADGSGQSRRLAVPDTKLQSFEFIDQHRILGFRLADDGEGLVWIDLDDASLEERPVIEQLFGLEYRLTPRFRAFGAHYNAQDQTGIVSLVDLDQFTLTTLAEAAADYALGWPPVADAPSFPFAYLKVGRFASPQDGIWVGWIPRQRIEAP